MKLGHDLKLVNEALNNAIISAYDSYEKEESRKQRRTDIDDLNKSISKQVKILKRNKDLFTEEEYSDQSKAISNSQKMVTRMQQSLDEPIIGRFQKQYLQHLVILFLILY